MSAPFASIATGAYIPPTNIPISDTDAFLYYFVEPYLEAHQLSTPSWRYAYILWFLIGGVFVGWSLAHQLAERGNAVVGGGGGGRAGGGDGAWAATWRKWSVRRINFKDVKKIDGGQGKRATVVVATGGVMTRRRAPSWSGPTVAQLITLLALLAWSFLMAYLGPDYLNPTTCTFGGTCPVALDQGPPKSTFADNDRALANRLQHQSTPALPRSSFPRLTWSTPSKWQGLASSDATLNPDGWTPSNDPLLVVPNYDVYKSWWTSSNRLGLIGFALLPLVITLALKHWPFNICATPFLINYGFDKTAMLHRWIGRMVWLFSTLHVVTWSVQLFLDKDPYGRPVWFDVWHWYKFIGGVVAYAVLTLLIFLSLDSLRSRFYEPFYFSHMILSVIFLAGCIVHYPFLASWAIIALALWGAERTYRLASSAWINGLGMKIASLGVAKASKGSSAGSTMTVNLLPSIRTREDGTFVPPPGYAIVQLLPGRTMRLTIRTPRTVRWRPGQHILLNLPSVRLFESHPYTIANADDRDPDLGGGQISQSGLDVGSTISLIVRTRKGFTRALWQRVVNERRERQSAPRSQLGAEEVGSGNGVMIRAYVGLPMGSSARTTWHSWSTLVIVCGGAGVSFGIGLLDYICRAMATRDANSQPNERRDSKGMSHGDGKPSAKEHPSRVKTTRVRFVWILKEFAHLAWIAPTLRHCIEIVPPEQLRVDLFVSTGRGVIPAAHHRPTPLNDVHAGPSPSTAGLACKQAGSSRDRIDTTMSEDEDSDKEDARRSGAAATIPSHRPDARQSMILGGYSLATPDPDESALDYVLFEGEDEDRTRAEEEVSQQVRREGKLRRALSRRAAGPKRVTVVDAVHSRSYIMHEYPPPPASQGASTVRSDRSGRPAGAASPFRGFERQDTDMESVSVLSSQHPDLRLRDEEDDVWLDIEGQDREDLDAVAELARTGKPRIGAILDEEVDRSQGATMVACCGPLSLNTLVRALVSDRIDPSRVARGDSRGSLGLVCEDFTT